MLIQDAMLILAGILLSAAAYLVLFCVTLLYLINNKNRLELLKQQIELIFKKLELEIEGKK